MVHVLNLIIRVRLCIRLLNCHYFHLISHSLLVSELFHRQLLFFHVLFCLFFVDLLLKCSLNSKLFLFLLHSHYLLLVSTLRQNIAVSGQLEINSVLKHPPSCFNTREVLFCDACVKVEVTLSVLSLFVDCLLHLIRSIIGLWIYIESLIVRIERLLAKSLRLLRCYSKIACFWSWKSTVIFWIVLSTKAMSLCFEILFLLSQEITFLYLSFKLVSCLHLFVIFLYHLWLIVICRSLSSKVWWPNHGMLVNVFLSMSVIDCHRWIGYALDTWRPCKVILGAVYSLWLLR